MISREDVSERLLALPQRLEEALMELVEAKIALDEATAKRDEIEDEVFLQQEGPIKVRELIARKAVPERMRRDIATLKRVYGGAQARVKVIEAEHESCIALAKMFASYS